MIFKTSLNNLYLSVKIRSVEIPGGNSGKTGCRLVAAVFYAGYEFSIRHNLEYIPFDASRLALQYRVFAFSISHFIRKGL